MKKSINYNFEWDFKKAKINIQKHKISFENAALIFKDNKATLNEQKIYYGE
jgi:uncharacterized DUF497 family protein